MSSLQKSAALQLVRLVWRHNREGTAHSWRRLNSSMHEAVGLAISAGMTFSLTDFATIHSEMRGHYWFGEGGEGFYSAAVIMGNTSACQSFEAWKNRKPFILSDRLAVGSQFSWDGQYCTLTSFADDGSAVIACAYSDVYPTSNESSRKSKVDKRYRITLEQMRAAERARKAQVASSRRAQEAEQRA